MGRTVHRNEVLRLADLCAATSVVEEVDFSDCLIVGPAVVIAAGPESSFGHCDLGGPDVDALVWVVPEERKRVVGAITLLNCTFMRCRFDRVGFAGPETLKMEMGMGITPPPPPGETPS